MLDRHLVWKGRRSGAAAGLRLSALALVLVLPGCVSLGAPAIPPFGASFPSWLASPILGTLGAVIVRLVFIRAGIDDALPIRLPVYIGVAAILGFLVSLLTFGR